jgi:hypothetical protein
MDSTSGTISNYLGTRCTRTGPSKSYQTGGCAAYYQEIASAVQSAWVSEAPCLWAEPDEYTQPVYPTHFISKAVLRRFKIHKNNDKSNSDHSNWDTAESNQ